MLVFIAVLVFTYLLNWFRFPWKEMVVAGSYLGRFGLYLLLPLIVYDLLQRDLKRILKIILGSMLFSLALIAALGFLQLYFFPSFLELGLYLKGWDPHIGRLLSTWFDPNFVGGYFAFILGPTLALMIYLRRQADRRWLILAVFSLFGLAATYLTFSRSAYLAILATIALLAFFKSRKLLVAVILLALIGFAVSPRVQERVGEGWESAKVFIGLDSQYALDPTAQLRLESWSHAVELIQNHPWIGIGYNRYAYEMNQRGYALLSDHDAGGSDSSLLTLWATTGIFGLLAYMSIGFTATIIALRRILKKTDFASFLNAGLLASFTGLLVHSFFVNSLLYPLIMVYVLVGIGLLDSGD
ncbi:MAG: O-antigen ligase family protein [Candidatus Peregrinibacteria bacterium]